MWTEEETKFLVDNYPDRGPTYCSSYLGRNHSCVRTKAFRMGLKMNKASNRKKTAEEYERELMERDLPLISLEPYINAHTPILHECFDGHQWKSTPTRILSGKGCPICASHGFNAEAPATLYYIHISKNNLEYYKIGVTNNSIKKRFGSDIHNIRIISEVLYDIGAEALAEEQRILKQYAQHRQNIPELLVSGGNTELFEFDILGLDT